MQLGGSLFLINFIHFSNQWSYKFLVVHIVMISLVTMSTQLPFTSSKSTIEILDKGEISSKLTIRMTSVRTLERIYW